MSFYFGESLANLLTIRIKERNDSIFDQVPRIFVTKVFILNAIIMSITWFNNETRCIPPSNNILPPSFLHRACWLKGFYVYPELHSHVKEAAYYGIPTTLDTDGFKKTGHGNDVILCKTGEKDERCQPMTKEYYNQYKWMPFYIAFLAFIFYFPYFIFQLTNKDLVRLKDILRNKEVCAQDVLSTFFKKSKSHRNENKIRILGNYLVKILYIFNGMISMLVIDRLTNDRFMSYGMEWSDWSKSIDLAEDANTGPTPLNKFLPVFGICDLVDVRLDLTRRYANNISVVCELTSHILYQYSFVIIWFVLVFSMIASSIGLTVFIVGHVKLMFKRTKRINGKVFQQYLTLREWEYLEIIGQINLPLHINLTKLINEQCLQQFWGAGRNVNIKHEVGQVAV